MANLFSIAARDSAFKSAKRREEQAKRKAAAAWKKAVRKAKSKKGVSGIGRKKGKKKFKWVKKFI